MGKIYAVKKGLVPGIYKTWKECEANVKGFSGAEYKSFNELQYKEALEFAGLSLKDYKAPKTQLSFTELHSLSYTELEKQRKKLLSKVVSIYVDGSYKDGKYSYGLAVVKDDNLLYTDCGVGTDASAAKMNNVAGELLGAMKAVSWAKRNNLKCKIYHDYEGISKWVTGEWKTKNPLTKKYAEYMRKNENTIYGFEWVKGHSQNPYNELADKLAGSAFDRNIRAI